MWWGFERGLSVRGEEKNQWNKGGFQLGTKSLLVEEG